MDKTGGVSSGRIDGTATKGPPMRGDAEINAENDRVDKKIENVCKGC
jgi:hypothetical protein